MQKPKAAPPAPDRAIFQREGSSPQPVPIEIPTKTKKRKGSLTSVSMAEDMGLESLCVAWNPHKKEVLRHIVFSCNQKCNQIYPFFPISTCLFPNPRCVFRKLLNFLDLITWFQGLCENPCLDCIPFYFFFGIAPHGAAPAFSLVSPHAPVHVRSNRRHLFHRCHAKSSNPIFGIAPYLPCKYPFRTFSVFLGENSSSE